MVTHPISHILYILIKLYINRLLIVDGHYSDVTIEFMEYCEEHQVVPFCLPLHSTHLIQPLDVVYLGRFTTTIAMQWTMLFDAEFMVYTKGIFRPYIYRHVGLHIPKKQPKQHFLAVGFFLSMDKLFSVSFLKWEKIDISLMS